MTEVNDRVMPCPDCGLTVSKRANTCPHCGAPLAEYRKGGNSGLEEKNQAGKKPVNWAGVFVGVVLMMLGLIWMVIYFPAK